MTINISNHIRNNSIIIENYKIIKYAPAPALTPNPAINDKFLIDTLFKEQLPTPLTSHLNLADKVSLPHKTPANSFYIDPSLNIIRSDTPCTIRIRHQNGHWFTYQGIPSKLASSSDFFKSALNIHSTITVELVDLMPKDLDINEIQPKEWIGEFLGGLQEESITEYLKDLDTSIFLKKILFFSTLSLFFQSKVIHDECDNAYLQFVKGNIENLNSKSIDDVKFEINCVESINLRRSLNYLTHSYFEVLLQEKKIIDTELLTTFGKHLLEITSRLATLISQDPHPTLLLKQIVANCPNLHQVDLQGIDISLEGVAFGPELELLSLDNNSLVSDEELQSAIYNCTKITSIRLANTNISLRNIQFGPNLEFLDIGNTTKITNGFLKTALSQCRNLLSLNLSETSISLEGVNLGPKIKHLSLIGNKYISNKSLKAAVENWESVQVLEIDETNISLEGIRLSPNLYWFSASDNNCLSEKILKENISNVKELTYLNLSGTNASLEGIIFGPRLQTLLLSQLKSITSEQLQHALANANGIATLDLDGCQVHLDGIPLGKNLRMLRLSGNKKVTEKELASLITNWKSLKEIDLSSTNISAEILIKESNFQAIKLFESCSKINPELYEQYKNLLKNKNFFLEAIDRNPKLFKKIPSEFRFQPSFIKEVLKANPAAIEFMNPIFREDEEITRLDRHGILPVEDLHKKHLKLAALLGASHLSIASEFRGYGSYIIYSHLIPLIGETSNSSLKNILPSFEEAYLLNILWRMGRFRSIRDHVQASLKDLMSSKRSYPCIIPVLTTSDSGPTAHTFSIIFHKGLLPNTVNVTILNTGDGLKYHVCYGHLQYELSIEFDNIPLDVVENVLLTDQLFNYPQTTTQLYSVFFHPLVQPHRLCRKRNGRLSQPGGSCSARAPLETLRYLLVDRAILPEAQKLGLSGYREIKSKLRANWIERIFNNFSLQDSTTLLVGSQIAHKLFKYDFAHPKSIENKSILSKERFFKLFFISKHFSTLPLLIKPIKNNQNWYAQIIDSIEQSNLFDLQKKIDSFRHISNSVMKKNNQEFIENFQNQIKNCLLDKLYDVEKNALIIPMLANPDIAYMIQKELLSLPVFAGNTSYKNVYRKLNEALVEVLIQTRRYSQHLRIMQDELPDTQGHPR